MTRLFGVIGHPIDHSLSPVMHQAAYEALGIDAYYGRFDVPPSELRAVLQALMRVGCEGLNVTVPLKEKVVRLANGGLSETARAMGAVNTLCVRRGKLYGENTDGAGFRRALTELGWKGGRGHAVILGAGGSARAVAWELSRARSARVTIANRTLARGRKLAAWLRKQRPYAQVEAVALGAVSLDQADVLVNTTSVGMDSRDGLIVNPTSLRRGMIVYDLVYHRRTKLVQEASARGCVAAGGTSMLLYQGAASFELWLRRRAPIEAMRRALNAALMRA